MEMEMEWIDGYDLGRLLTPGMLRLARERAGDERRAYLKGVIVTAASHQPRLKPRIAIAVLRDGPSAPSALHREGIVDGAVRPSNFMLERTRNAKLIDIGTAFAREDAPPRSARVRSVAQGSPHSPPDRDGNPKGSEMNLRDNDPLHAAIDARLAGLVANCPTPPA